MKRFITRGVSVGVLVCGGLVLAIAPAAAETTPQPTDRSSQKRVGPEKQGDKVLKPVEGAGKSRQETTDKKPRIESRPKSDARVEVKQDTASVRPAKSPAKASSRIPADREAAALAFARENHPELAALLEGLKQNAPREYEAALVDLDRAVERLNKTRERSTERYEFELSDWKITSRIRLLAARLTMSPDPGVEAELRTALRERLELRVTAQRSERDRLQARVEKMTQQIDDQQAHWDAILEKQFNELRTSLPAARTSQKAKPRKSEAAGPRPDEKQ